MDKKQIHEELFELKNRIQWLEDRALEQQVGSTEPDGETSSTTTSSQRHQRVLLQPLQQDPNNIMIPSLHPVLSQQNVWEKWNRSKHEQLHQTTPSVTGVNEEDIFARKELSADNTHPYDGKHMTYQVARCDDKHMDVDTKYVTALKRHEAYEAARKIDVTIKTNLKEAMNETCQEEDVNKTYPVINIENISIMRAGTNKPPGTAIFAVKGLHTREQEEDPFMKEDTPADNKLLAKYEYEGKPNVQDNINMRDVLNVPLQEELPADNEVVTKYECEEEPDMPDMPPQEELPADNGLLTKYEYSHSRNVMTSKTETLDVAKMLAYMDENYNIPSQMGTKTNPLMTWGGRIPRYERTRTTPSRPTKRRTSPTMNRPTAWLTRRSLEARHDHQRLRGTGGGITKCVPRVCLAISPR
jgi:hypothetical protein